MPHILILEDNAELVFELTERYETQGYEVTWARGAEEALGILNTIQVDVVIADIFILRDGNHSTDGGITLIGMMRSTQFMPGKKDLSKIPVIAMTGAVRPRGNPNILQVAQTIGARYALEKPVAMEEMDELISFCLDISAAQCTGSDWRTKQAASMIGADPKYARTNS